LNVAAADALFHVMRDHRLIDERSLAFDKVIAARLRENPDLVNKARSNLSKWILTADASLEPTLREWQKLVDGPMDLLLSTLENTDECATQLRQSSPFCGILTPEERTQILQEYQDRESRAA
jgi:hypothetical protein